MLRRRKRKKKEDADFFIGHLYLQLFFSKKNFSKLAKTFSLLFDTNIRFRWKPTQSHELAFISGELNIIQPKLQPTL